MCLVSQSLQVVIFRFGLEVWGFEPLQECSGQMGNDFLTTPQWISGIRFAAISHSWIVLFRALVTLCGWTIVARSSDYLFVLIHSGSELS